MDFESKATDRSRDLAQAKLDRQTRRLDEEKAAAEYAAKRTAVSENISRLREQRLAHEAAEGVNDAKPAAPPVARKKVRRVSVKR